MIESKIQINPDAVVSEMLESYKSGNRNHIIALLARDHAGLTAFFLVEGIRQRYLTQTDVNVIVNSLMDRRTAIVQG